MASGYSYWLLTCFMLLFPPLPISYEFLQSRATYYGSPECLGTPMGACGYGDYGRTVLGGNVAGVSALYKNGSGCGACYQIMCKIPQLCKEEGVVIVVTDYGEGDHTDFILSTRAYTAMAIPSASLELTARGVVDVEYRRVYCQYEGYNIVVKVHENSHFSDYLAIVLLYQGGMSEVVKVDIWREECGWVGMRAAFGSVWDVSNPPEGVSLRVLFRDGNGEKPVEMKGVIPEYWKPGYAYDTHVKLY